MGRISDLPPSWLNPPTLADAVDIQKALADRVKTVTSLGTVGTVGGVDISHNPRNQKASIHAAAALLDVSTLSVIKTAYSSGMPTFPYVPGFLGFREVPQILKALDHFSKPPDLLLVDGHGVAHPRRFGIASHLGVLTGLPTIGVAKSILVGTVQGSLGAEMGARAPLVWRGEIIGMALRTKVRCNPLYISVGHRVAFDDAIKWVLRCLKGYRHPEPIRAAHAGANRARLSA